MPVTRDYANHVRGVMQNMATADFTNFLFNPQQLQPALAVAYSRLRPLGGTHQELHYDGTDNLKIPFTLEWSLGAYAEEQRTGRTISLADAKSILEQFQDEHNFFVELGYPVGAANDALRRAPPTVLLMWPRHISMECVVNGLTWNYTDFSEEGYVTNYSVQLQLEEWRTWRLTSSEARRIGFKRAKPLL
ncbi:MAG: hypothetical protein GTN69_01915 [Armatimonadetes bacterium]|nr:hypothetical protein [Armatimonadota bacterium]